MQLDYPYPRPQFLKAMFSAGERAGAAAIMPWELVPWHVNPNASGGFDFGIDDPSFGPIAQMIQYMDNKVRAVDRNVVLLASLLSALASVVTQASASCPPPYHGLIIQRNPILIPGLHKC